MTRKKQETEFKTEEKSIGEGTATSGNDWAVQDVSTENSINDTNSSPVAGEAWPIETTDQSELPHGPDSEKNLDNVEEGDHFSGNKVSGVMIVTLFEDETIEVKFPKLGRWTLGRLEKAMSRMLREVIVERAKFHRLSVGQPEEFVTSGVEE
jgi:hypothetical protein